MIGYKAANNLGDVNTEESPKLKIIKNVMKAEKYPENYWVILWKLFTNCNFIWLIIYFDLISCIISLNAISHPYNFISLIPSKSSVYNLILLSFETLT